MGVIGGLQSNLAAHIFVFIAHIGAYQVIKTISLLFFFFYFCEVPGIRLVSVTINIGLRYSSSSIPGTNVYQCSLFSRFLFLFYRDEFSSTPRVILEPVL